MDIIDTSTRTGVGEVSEKSLTSRKVEMKGDKEGGGPGYAPKPKNAPPPGHSCEEAEPDQVEQHLLDIII